MISNKRAVGILGTGSYVPKKILTNIDLEKIVDTSDQWIRERTGIEERHIAEDGVNTSHMAISAAQKAIQAAGIEAKDIDAIIVATLTPDTIIPSTACLVQAAIGAEKAAAFDLSAGCSGFVYGAITANAYISSGMYDKVLVIGAEVLSRYVNWEDRNTCVLFGDGAGAAIFGAVKDGYGIKGYNMGANGHGGEHLSIPSSGVAIIPSEQAIQDGKTFIQMDGREVYKFAVKAMGNTVIEALKTADMNLEDLDYFIPHQANIRIIQSAAKRLNLSEDKVFVNLPKYGNTSAASIPLALDEAVRANLIKKGDNVALSGFGAGLTWAGIIIKWC